MTAREPVKLLQPDLRQSLLEALDSVDTASAPTVSAAAGTVLDMLSHDHQADDVHCDNLVGVLGQQAKYLVVRLLRVEEELHRELIRGRSGPRPPMSAAPEPGAVPPP